MTQAAQFSDVVDAADQLSLDEQEELVEILRKRLADCGRRRLLREIEEARLEISSGGAVKVTPRELMQEIMS